MFEQMFKLSSIQSLSLSRKWRTYKLLNFNYFQRNLITFQYKMLLITPETTITTTTTKTTKATTLKTPTPLSRHHSNQSHNQHINKYDINSNLINDEYEKAIQALNSLQSNAEALRRAVTQDIRQSPLTDTVNVLNRSGLTLNDLDKLSFIHVSGTKGKGSTCALTECILRQYGIKTGFFSSPHLVSVQERIRINGQPISKDKFTKAFWSVYERLQSSSKHASDMPAYFKFLTILSFHIFLAEQVDVVILEVGIGGELDCTNIIRNTCTVGISSLGLEHTQLLGTTLPEIAWQKAGIIKANSNVFTAATPPACLNVIRERCREKLAKSVTVVPSLSSYRTIDGSPLDLMHCNDMVRLNGSLAIQLAYDWLEQQKLVSLRKSLELSREVMEAINVCSWPGRCQTLKLFNFNIYLDGAHTVESMQICRNWFQKVTENDQHPKVLIFNSTGDRDSQKLLSVLQSGQLSFDLALFAPNITSMNGNVKDNQTVHNYADQYERAVLHANNWHALKPDSQGKVFESIVDTLQYLQGIYHDKQTVDILVTGSLHLIGATLLALEELNPIH